MSLLLFLASCCVLTSAHYLPTTNKPTEKPACADGNQAGYRGKLSVTKGGLKCQRWDSQSPHEHSRTPANYPNSGLEENFCRNPDGKTEPAAAAWCYTEDEGTRWGYCDVPRCEEQDTTKTSRTAGASTSSPPSPTSSWDYTIIAKTDGVTMPEKKREKLRRKKERKSVIACADGNQAGYRGKLSVTNTGLKCQRWDSQLPHEHSRTPANYPNSGLEENFCRNPDGKTEPNAWCYTEDKGTRWQYCDVPRCEGTASSSINSTIMATTPRTVLCPAGYQLSGASCQACPLDQYNSEGGGNCTQCPTGTFTLDIASTTSDNCTEVCAIPSTTGTEIVYELGVGPESQLQAGDRVTYGAVLVFVCRAGYRYQGPYHNTITNRRAGLVTCEADVVLSDPCISTMSTSSPTLTTSSWDYAVSQATEFCTIPNTTHSVYFVGSGALIFLKEGDRVAYGRVLQFMCTTTGYQYQNTDTIWRFTCGADVVLPDTCIQPLRRKKERKGVIDKIGRLIDQIGGVIDQVGGEYPDSVASIGGGIGGIHSGMNDQGTSADDCTLVWKWVTETRITITPGHCFMGKCFPDTKSEKEVKVRKQVCE